MKFPYPGPGSWIHAAVGNPDAPFTAGPDDDGLRRMAATIRRLGAKQFTGPTDWWLNIAGLSSRQIGREHLADLIEGLIDVGFLQSAWTSDAPLPGYPTVDAVGPVATPAATPDTPELSTGPDPIAAVFGDTDDPFLALSEHNGTMTWNRETIALHFPDAGVRLDVPASMGLDRAVAYAVAVLADATADPS